MDGGFLLAVLDATLGKMRVKLVVEPPWWYKATNAHRL